MAPRHKYTLFSMMKDEGHSLIEWVAYHHMIGFDNICVYTNDCGDGTDDMLIRLQELGYCQHFRNDVPEHYAKGFPWHPHRGIETITYVLEGEVEHSDSLGNSGTLGPGSVQWMTAGSGILHQEMPRGNDRGQMHGFQLWGNLPSDQKMTAPRYQDIQGADIPLVQTLTFIFAVLIVFFNLIADVLYGILDPRIRYD